MKRFKYLQVLFGMLCLPFIMHAQVICIERSANIIVTGDAKVVLHDGSQLQGSFGTSSAPVVLTGYSEKNSLVASKGFPVSDNILIDKTFGATWETNNMTYIYLGRASMHPKASGFQTFMQVFPNPTTERVTLTVSSSKAVAGTIILQDESGRVLERRRVNYLSGLNTIQWDLTRYGTGSYLLVFENAPGKYMKIVKQ